VIAHNSREAWEEFRRSQRSILFRSDLMPWELCLAPRTHGNVLIDEWMHDLRTCLYDACA
jgi:hypothetical protein